MNERKIMGWIVFFMWTIAGLVVLGLKKQVTKIDYFLCWITLVWCLISRAMK